jgi:hypothetical protein
VHYCGYNPTVVPLLTTFTHVDCGSPTAFDLTSALLAYTPGNPGWSAPFPGSSWIGPVGFPDQPSSDYRARVGTYEYVTTFNVPAGATNVSLQLQLKADNAAVVYLNGTEIGRHQFLEDCTLEQGATGSCNWIIPLNITDAPASFVTGTNTLAIDVVNTRIGYEVGGIGHTPGATCEDGPALFGTAGFGGTPILTTLGHLLDLWSAVNCNNPTGLDFVAKIFFTPALPIPLFVIGNQEAHGIGATVNFWGAQWWKNNQMTGTVDNGVAGFKGFASSAQNICGGTWTSEPGNSSDPPFPISDNIAIIVTSKVLKQGSAISGDIQQILLVHQDGHYNDNPGHEGNGTVISVLCPTS